REVSRSYARPAGAVRALDRVDLTIDRGDFVSVSGPSGSGKSTLLHVLGLLDTPTSGSYTFDGADVSTLADDERARVRNRKVGLVFQAFHLVPHLTLVENVELPLLYRASDRASRRRRAAAALDRVGLADRFGHLPDE